jgi:hypothetical protein
MDKFRNEDKADYLSLCREFEVKKRGIRPDSTVKITLRLPLALTEKFQDQFADGNPCLYLLHR